MNTYFTPGPTQRFPTIPQHLKNAVDEEIISIAHRGKGFQVLFEKATNGLRKLMNIPANYHIFFVSSATEAMERIIQGTVEKNSIHFTTGVFSERMYDFARDLKKNARQVKAKDGETFTHKELIIPKTVELACFTHNETSTGVMMNLTDIYNVKKSNPNILLSLDIVSSAPYVNVDFRYIDCAFISVQKGFGLPAGLGIVIVSPQAIMKAHALQKKDINIGANFHNLVGMLYQSQTHEMIETPNILALYLLGNVLEDMLTIGIETIRKQTNQKAKLIWDFFENNMSKYSLFVKNQDIRSPTVTVVEVKGGSMSLIEKLKSKSFIVGFGVRPEYKEKHIRITNFPAHTLEDVKKLLSFF